MQYTRREYQWILSNATLSEVSDSALQWLSVREIHVHILNSIVIKIQEIKNMLISVKFQ